MLHWPRAKFLSLLNLRFSCLEESKACKGTSLLARTKNLNSVLEKFKDRIGEKSEKKSVSSLESSSWNTIVKMAMGHFDELDRSRQRLNARLQEDDETIETLNQKVLSTEKATCI